MAEGLAGGELLVVTTVFYYPVLPPCNATGGEPGTHRPTPRAGKSNVVCTSNLPAGTTGSCYRKYWTMVSHFNSKPQSTC
jgi:hypothetical protein